MGRFDGVLICTDLDGTLLKNDKTISCENIEAIEYFKREGGYFTFVTGRMPFFVSYVLDTIKPNAPFGCVNGAGLYDGIKKEYVWTASMPDKVTELVKCIDDHFDFIRSEKTLYEILPKGICKGTSVIKLCDYLNIDIRKSIAIGDYNNDISMFRTAGTGIAVSNACEEALNAADFVTVSNEEHAIAKVVCDLERGKYSA